MSASKPLTSESIQKFLTHCHRREFSAKASIIRQGDPAGELYYITAGSVTVLLEDDKGHEIVLAYLNPGDFFGEIGLFNEDASRSALVRARTACEIAQISYSKLRRLTDLYPDLIIAMTTQLARRLRNTNRKLGDLSVYGRLRSGSPHPARPLRTTRRDDSPGRHAGTGHAPRTSPAGRLFERDGRQSA